MKTQLWKAVLVFGLLFVPSFAVLLFLILWLQRGFNGALDAFERFADDCMRMCSWTEK